MSVWYSRFWEALSILISRVISLHDHSNFGTAARNRCELVAWMQRMTPACILGGWWRRLSWCCFYAKDPQIHLSRLIFMEGAFFNTVLIHYITRCMVWVPPISVSGVEELIRGLWIDLVVYLRYLSHLLIFWVLKSTHSISYCTKPPDHDQQPTNASIFANNPFCIFKVSSIVTCFIDHQKS